MKILDQRMSRYLPVALLSMGLSIPGQSAEDFSSMQIQGVEYGKHKSDHLIRMIAIMP